MELDLRKETLTMPKTRWYGIWVSDWPGYHGPARTKDEVKSFTSLREAGENLRSDDDILCLNSPGSYMLWVATGDLQIDLPGPDELLDAPYPDRIVKIGPRGGIQVEYC